ncbi:hypothetical protein A4E84_20165 [Streptomyces qaidamensis]|uniref:Uncharacterized protein n=1 Tax=Streptomyces qaidamensis TaxID=1783515 RepID=A0A143C2G6_9ACTN|nr:hypothetical protein [Streptomyces qaidamensis]AMW11604.1 hypothetical protein A4E84_20165 [Streptomyces qaidamensis]
MQLQYPYVEIGASDVLQPEAACTVLLQFSTEGSGIAGVSEQDIVDAVKAHLAQLPNITVNAHRYEVTASPA